MKRRHPDQLPALSRVPTTDGVDLPSQHWHAVEGTPSPLGATSVENEAAYNFALYAEFATHVALLLYSEPDLSIPTYEYVLDPLANKTGRIWHCRVKALSVPQARYYAYRVDGPRETSEGHRFDSQKVLLLIRTPDACAFQLASAGRQRAGPGRMPAGLHLVF